MARAVKEGESGARARAPPLLLRPACRARPTRPFCFLFFVWGPFLYQDAPPPPHPPPPVSAGVSRLTFLLVTSLFDPSSDVILFALTRTPACFFFLRTRPRPPAAVAGARTPPSTSPPSTRRPNRPARGTKAPPSPTFFRPPRHARARTSLPHSLPQEAFFPPGGGARVFPPRLLAAANARSSRLFVRFFFPSPPLCPPCVRGAVHPSFSTLC
jgi:hypothetical protein